MLRHTRHDLGIEILRLRAVGEMKNLLAIPVLDPRLPPPAAAQKRGGQEEQRNDLHGPDDSSRHANLESRKCGTSAKIGGLQREEAQPNSARAQNANAESCR